MVPLLRETKLVKSSPLKIVPFAPPTTYFPPAWSTASKAFVVGGGRVSQTTPSAERAIVPANPTAAKPFSAGATAKRCWSGPVLRRVQATPFGELMIEPAVPTAT